MVSRNFCNKKRFILHYKIINLFIIIFICFILKIKQYLGRIILKKIIVLGSTGLLGRQVYNFSSKNYTTIGFAKKNADYNFCLSKFSKLKKIINLINPDIIINCAAITSLDICENKPNQAIKINSDLVLFLSEITRNINCRLIHISTDHYYVGKKKKNKESDKVKLLNTYAKSKYIAEINVLMGEQKNLVIRTNFLGFNSHKDKTNFGKWLLENISKKKKIELFEDYFHSPLHVNYLVKIIFKLIKFKASGLFNVASSDVISKLDFALKVFSFLDAKPLYVKSSIKKLDTLRANSNGMDVKKVEDFLKIKMQSSDDTARQLASDFFKYKKTIL